MQRLSEKWTWFSKRVGTALFILLWIMLFAGMSWIMLSPRPSRNHVDLAGRIVLTVLWVTPLAMIAYAMWAWPRIMKIADEVWIDGKELIVKRAGKEARIPVSDIKSVESKHHLYNDWDSTIALHLIAPNPEFGDTIVFLWPYWGLSNVIEIQVRRRLFGLGSSAE